MKIRSLCALGKMRPYFIDRHMVTLSHQTLSGPVGSDPLLHNAEAIYDFIQRNIWLHQNCLVGLYNSDNQLVQPGEVFMNGSRSSLMRCLLRWEALRIVPIWIDGFDNLPEYERSIRAVQLDRLDQARQKLHSVGGWYQSDQKHYELARAVKRTGYWALENLPPLGDLEWPTGKVFGLTNPNLSADAVETGYLEGIFSMIEGKESFHGTGGSIAANELFGVALMTPDRGHEFLVDLHIQILANRADATYASRPRAIA
ncbi:hypothetical protein HBO12_27895 [Pseudomonas sp. WS 5059]|uniref:Uncharacterized protein n=2 Tax=Pseudomonas TaxID=286 RepID=A0A7Y1QPF5_9PSED|nr:MULTISPECIES: hypothetical protein [Pseudomonas]MBU0939770.1 hypothetical protein [Gammaproteobacteria bacterium]AIG04717.1 hypothetical protein HZ99_21980 [Pseudomonas fluorescens]MBN0978196.1 hypothetical protein [Pseudomonas hygromyciniae]MCF5507500.1 hypothetical protein [Pseudomonas sp. PA-3-6H]MCF5516919.1 hypothetical protein [Pseudomonas sp. PA-3-6E]